MDFLELQRAIKERPTLPKYQAGKALGLGRRLTDQFVADGKMPVVGPREAVPTEWLRQVLQIQSET